MERTDSKQYVEWSLENTAKILTINFPKKHILLIRPSRYYLTHKYKILKITYLILLLLIQVLFQDIRNIQLF